MKLKSISIENFMGITKPVTVNLEEGLTALLATSEPDLDVVVTALSIALGYQWPSANHFPRKPMAQRPDMAFTCIFHELPEAVTSDRRYYFRLEAEHMLNEQGELQITRAFRMTPEGLQERAYVRALHPSAEGLGDLMQVNNLVLKHRLTNSTVSATSVDRRSNTSIRHALWQHCPYLKLRPTDISLCRGDALLIWQALQNNFPLLRVVDCTQFRHPNGSAVAPNHANGLAARELSRTSPRHYTQRFSNVNSRNCEGASSEAEQWVIVPTQLINKSEPPLFMDPEVFLADTSASRPAPDPIGYLYFVKAPEQFAETTVRTEWLSRLQEISAAPGSAVCVTMSAPSALSGLPVKTVQVLSHNADGAIELMEEQVADARAMQLKHAGIPQVRSWPNTHAF